MLGEPQHRHYQGSFVSDRPKNDRFPDTSAYYPCGPLYAVMKTLFEKQGTTRYGAVDFLNSLEGLS
jgi:hypothetical protein